MLTPANYKTLHEPKPFPLRRKSLRQPRVQNSGETLRQFTRLARIQPRPITRTGDKANARHWMQLGVVAGSAGLPVHQVNVLVGLGLHAPRPSADS
jgi:hypothetical protein